MENLELGFKTFTAALMGLIAGLMLFFNLPSFNSYIFQTLLLTFLCGLIGNVLENFSTKLVVVGVIILASLGLVFGVYTTECSLGDIRYDPSKNPLNGEVTVGDFDGFRLKACDKGAPPWYFEESNKTRLEVKCENNPDRRRCKTVQ